jgi:S-DNA-T family DNA segregation ATPase FtsK/SpoIIIE
MRYFVMFHVLSLQLMSCNPVHFHSRNGGHCLLPPPAGVALAVLTGSEAGCRLGLTPGSVIDGAALGGAAGPCLQVLPTAASSPPEVIARGRQPVSVGGRRIDRATALSAGMRLRVGSVGLEVVGPTPPPRALVVRPGGWRVLDRSPVTPGPQPLGELAAPADPREVAPMSSLGLLGLAGPVLTGVVVASLAGGRAALMMITGAVVAVLVYIVTRLVSWRRRVRTHGEGLASLARFGDQLAAAASADRAAREHAHPPRHAIAAMALAVDRRLWSRRLDHAEALTARIGARVHDYVPPLVGPIGTIATAGLARMRSTGRSPAVVDLHRSLGVVGPARDARSLVRGIVLDLAVHHGPADLRVAVVGDPALAEHWTWIGSLPHAQGDGGPLVAYSVANLLDRLGTVGASGEESAGAAPPVVVVLDAPVDTDADRAAVRALLGGRYGAASLLMLASEHIDLGAWCATVIDIRPDGTHGSVREHDGSTYAVELSGCAAAVAEDVAVALHTLRDPEAASGAALPDACRLVDLLGLPSGAGIAPYAARFQPQNGVERMTDVEGMADDEGTAPGDTSPSWDDVISIRWQQTAGTAELVVPLGVDDAGTVVIDLVRDGPHALVAGTTGAGKSELLRSLVATIAATADPEHATFVLIDYKGGSAFDGCADLPHVVGLVTDLDDGLAERALTCLEAEVSHRERLLRRVGASDLVAYRRARQADPALDPLPRLVVVVDEFATLVAELPDFVAALVDVAQRGRSLGIHLILATQRPAGAVTDAMRTNISLRIALRVVDVTDSRDVIGVADAASISRRTPGRAVARLGPGELLTFQTARVTAATSEIDASTDLDRLVRAVRRVHAAKGFAPARRPWLDPLPGRVALAAITTAPPPIAGEGRRRFGPLAIGLADEPRSQRQRPWMWTPDDGPLLVEGLPGSGVSTTLCTIAAAAASAATPAELHLYAFDGPGVPLASLAHLPHCGGVIAPDDTDRRARLVHRLSDERARRAVAMGARHDDARILVLVDHVVALRGDLDDAHDPTLIDAFDRVVTEGAALGIHVVLGGDRPTASGHRLDATLANRLTLHLPDPHRRSNPGRPVKVVPGRARDAHGIELQIAEPYTPGHHGTLPNAMPPVASPSRSLGPTSGHAPAVAAMPTLVLPESLPSPPTAKVGERIVALGLNQRDLSPAWVTLHPGDHLLVAGPGRSGKSSVLAGLARQWPMDQRVVVAGARSPLPGLVGGAGVTVASLDELTHHIVGRSTPMVVVIDDADLIDDPGPLGVLLAACRPGQHVVVAGRPDRLRGLFRHWTGEVRRSRLGVLLRPDEADADLLGVRLPARTAPMRAAGRGVLVTDRGWCLGQAVTTAPDA